jgi:RNA 3'-terminal phosphate cyclase (ATP)
VALAAAELAATGVEAGVPVDKHLADQLLIPMALAHGGSFRTTQPSQAFTTNAIVIQKDLPVQITFPQARQNAWRTDVRRAGAVL